MPVAAVFARLLRHLRHLRPLLALRAPACALLCALAFLLMLTACAGNDPGTLMADARKLRHHDARAAVMRLKSLLQQDGQHAAARQLLGEIYLELGDAAAAEKELSRAKPGSEPAPSTALLLNRAWLMQGQYERVLGANPAATEPAQLPPTLALRGHALLGLGRADAARQLFERALELNGDQPEALQGLARIEISAGKADAALVLLRRALVANPRHIDCLRLHAALLRAQGEIPHALATYGKILEIQPHNLPAQLDMVNLLLDADRIKEARSALAAARSQAGPILPVVYAEALADYREHRLQAALASLQSVLRVDPEHAAATLLAGAVHAALGNSVQGGQYLRKFLAAHPGHLYASKLIASLHVRERQPGHALKVLQPLIASHPQDAELLTLAGEAHLLSRQFASAASLLAQASGLRPQAAPLRLSLALSHLGSGDTGRAVAELERAAQLDPGGERTAMLLVMTHLRAGAHDKAMAAVGDMEKRGDSPLIQNLKGGIFLAAQDGRAARTCFQRALVLEPLYLPALANLAQLDVREGKADQARRRYETALAHAPSNGAIMEALADISLQQGDRRLALGWLERAHRATPNALPLALRLADLYARAGELPKSLLFARKLQAAHPESVDALAMLAQIQSQQPNPVDALESYARLAALAPASPLPHLRAATVRLAMNEPGPALAALRRALALDPDHVDTQQALLQVLLRQKQYADAQALVADMQRRQPRQAAGYKLEGDLLSAQDKYAAALKAYEHAHALQPDGALLTRIHAALGRSGRLEEADDRVEAWLRSHPGDTATRMYLASSKLVNSQTRAAIAHLQAVLKAEPDNVLALNDLAWASHGLAEPSARAYAERAHALAPHSPAVMDTLGWILLGQGELARALPLLRQASAMAPQAAEIRFHFGSVLARSGDKQGARRELQRLLAQPGHEPVRARAEALLASL